MPTPNFRLSNLLDLRQAERDRCQLALGLIQQAEQVLSGQIAKLEHELAHLRRQRAQAAAPGMVRPDLLAESQRYAVSLASRRRELETEHKALLAEVERCRETLTSANRELKVLEKLRDRQQVQHIQRQERLETSQRDESAASNFIANGDCGKGANGGSLAS